MGREEKRREGKGREGKGREGKGRGGKGREQMPRVNKGASSSMILENVTTCTFLQNRSTKQQRAVETCPLQKGFLSLVSIFYLKIDAPLV